MRTIQAKDLQVGMKIYHSNFYARDKWRAVTQVEVGGKDVEAYVGVSSHPTIDTRTRFVFYPEQPVAIK